MAEYTIVIPSIKEDILTLDSIPEYVPVSVEREGSLNEARNRGVRTAETELVMIMDDDISFPESTLEELASRAGPDRLLGMEDWDFDLIAGRVMVFHKQLWRDVGGFDTRLESHMGDTDFGIKVKKAGFKIEQLPQDMFDHREHERSVTTWDRTWRTAYLMAKHPRWAPRLARGVLG